MQLSLKNFLPSASCDTIVHAMPVPDGSVEQGERGGVALGDARGARVAVAPAGCDVAAAARVGAAVRVGDRVGMVLSGVGEGA